MNHGLYNDPDIPAFKPEPLAALRARFPQAIAEQFTDPCDPRLRRPLHFFDFEDNFRLHISRDLNRYGSFITVSGWPTSGRQLPIPILLIRLTLHFGALSDHRYGMGEFVVTGPEAAVLMVRVDDAPAAEPEWPEFITLDNDSAGT
jgi:hypothetical protein